RRGVWPRSQSRRAGNRPGRRCRAPRRGPMAVLTTKTDLAYQQCINPACRATLAVGQPCFACPECGDLLDVGYHWDRLPVPRRLSEFEAKWSNRLDPLNFSGVWRFRELLPFAPPEMVVTIGEGQTLLQAADKVGQYAGMAPGCLKLQYEGMNPSGSFKD